MYRIVGRLSRAPTSLCPTSCLPKRMGKRSTAVQVPLLQCLDVPAGFHGVIRRMNRRYCTESHQSRSTRRSEHPTNCGKFSRPCWKNRQLHWPPIDNSYPCKARSKKKLSGVNLERHREEANTSGNHAETDRSRPGTGIIQLKASPSQTRSGDGGGKTISGKRQSCQPKMSEWSKHKRQAPWSGKATSSQCSNLFSRCKERGATEYWNSLARRKRMSRKSARLWHTQCGKWKQGPRLPNQAQKLTGSRVKTWVQTTSSLLGKTYLV